MPNYSLKPGRGPSAVGAIGGIVGIGFGVLWTILAFAITKDAPFPLVHTIFPAFGILFIIAGIAGVVANFYNATQPNRFSVMDVVESGSEPDPLSPRRTTGSTPPVASSGVASGFCRYCGAALRAGDRFCSRCGKAVDA